MRKLAWLCMLLVFAVFPAASQPIGAAAGITCELFDYQEDATAALEMSAKYESTAALTQQNLDPDGNGIACDELPTKPAVIANAVYFGGNFSTFEEQPVISGSGISASVDARLAGISLDPVSEKDKSQSQCPTLVNSKKLRSLFELESGRARHFYATYGDGSRLPDKTDGHLKIDALVWTILGDPQQPVMVNEWLVAQGLAFPATDSATLDASSVDRIKNAANEAKHAKRGVWGSCQIASDLLDAKADAPNTVVSRAASGSQVVRFTIPQDGAYEMDLIVSPPTPVFVAADLYGTDSTWYPEFSIASADPGKFTATGWLSTGSYYVQVKAAGAWRVTINMMPS